VNRDTPSLPGPAPESDADRLSLEHDDVFWSRAMPPRPKFQHNYAKHLLWFGLTFLSATLVPVLPAILYFATDSVTGPAWSRMWTISLSGLWFSVPLITILTAHEFGHYFACRFYNVDATLPYYIPFPFGLAGTLGAVIRIREPFPSKKALFDIGIAGPIAGFVALLPFLVAGLFFGSVVAPMAPPGALEFGEPILFRWLAYLRHGPIPAGHEVGLGPVGIAAWWGMLVTFLNLLPFGQLDGGHISYAVLGRYSKYLSAATLVTVLALYLLVSQSWAAFALIMLGASIAFGFGHPFVVDESAPLDAGRRAVAGFALLMLILCFMSNPIAFRTNRPRPPVDPPQASSSVSPIAGNGSGLQLSALPAPEPHAPSPKPPTLPLADRRPPSFVF
jgi:hypothetical protein